jgi:hypothetical protein
MERLKLIQDYANSSNNMWLVKQLELLDVEVDALNTEINLLKDAVEDLEEEYNYNSAKQ